MNEKELKITMSSLLHDIGKVIYREGGDVRRHSLSGYDYLKDEAGITDKDILVGVKYHHAQNLKSASLDNDSVAYIVYMADNIASATDRREREEQESGFEISAPLESVFNILNKIIRRCIINHSFLILMERLITHQRIKLCLTDIIIIL